jgi:hypothetical protein
MNFTEKSSSFIHASLYNSLPHSHECEQKKTFRWVNEDNLSDQQTKEKTAAKAACAFARG